MESTHERRTDPASRLIIPLLIVAALLPFVATLVFGYVLDDTTVIRSNPDLAGWTSLAKVWTVPYGGLPSHYSGLYRPLLMTLFAVVWNAGGHWALWFHLLAVVMHVLASVLVWRLLERALDRWPAFLAAAWFAVHPVHVEAVANVANSAEVLVAVWTCALALYVARRDEDAETVSWGTPLIAGALFLAAFLTKESGAMAPMLAAIALWGWRRPLAAPSERSVSILFARWRPVLIAWVIAALIVFALRALVLGNPVLKASIAAAGLDQLSTPQRIWAMLSLVPTIVGLLFWPSAPNPHYGPTTLARGTQDWVTALTVVATLSVLAGFAWLARRGDRRPLAALSWTALAFLPASNLLVPTGQILAERTLYVPSIGAAMLMGLALQGLGSRATRSRAAHAIRSAGIGFVALLLALLAAQSARSIWVWRTNASVFAQMIAADSAGYRGYWLAGLEASHQGRREEAKALLGRAHALYPRDRGLLMDYSTMLSERGEHARAASVAAELMAWPSLRTDPYSVSLYLNALGNAYGPDSVIAAARRLMADTPSPAAARYLDEALRITR